MYGLLGRKLSHSLSVQIHSCFGDYPYELFCREPEELDAFFADENIKAFNVTIPYKKEAYNRCDVLSPTAGKIGSVNTVVRKDGKLYGYNTDLFGFKYMASSLGADFSGKKVLVLGSGGASLTVVTAAQELGAREIIVVSRSGENNYENISKHYDSQIIVNATPVGMYPDNGKAAVDLKKYKSVEFVLDLIYNPCMTELLLEADELKIPYINGLTMLVAQGLRSAEFFFGSKFDDGLITSTENKINEGMKNIVLTGMPGCGKTTVSEIIGEKLGRKVLDTDALIEKEQGKSIPEIFSQNGENYFRDAEEKVVSQCGKELGNIISTGGGSVLRERNRKSLKQNGIIIYLNRNIEELATDGRPLSKDINAVKEIYNTRREIYENFADYKIDVDRDPAVTAERVLKCVSSL